MNYCGSLQLCPAKLDGVAMAGYYSLALDFFFKFFNSRCLFVHFLDILRRRHRQILSPTMASELPDKFDREPSPPLLLLFLLLHRLTMSLDRIASRARPHRRHWRHRPLPN